jgi:cell division septal protein FtsQ
MKGATVTRAGTMKDAASRSALVVLCAAALVGAATGAPFGMRRLDLFHVARVEVSGTQHLDVAAAVAASGITSASNLFEDPERWRAALLRQPLIADVSIERRVPDTIILHVRESQPVAFARTPELRPIDETGRVLPVDPSADDLDLPVLACDTRVGADGLARDAETLRAARFLGIVSRLEPALLSRISEVGAYGDAVRIVLRNALDAEILVTAEPTAQRLAELQYTLADLSVPRFAGDSTRVRYAGIELARVTRIDGRFHDQIVVGLHRGKN